MPEITDARLEYLFNCYFEKTGTREEKEELLRLINRSQYDDQLKDLMDRAWLRLSSAYRLNGEQSDRILSEILTSLTIRPESTSLPAAGIIRMRIIRWSAVAAAVLLLFVAGWEWYKNNPGERMEKPPAMTVQYKNDIAPGGNKAVLILANGSAVVLDSAHNGVVARQGNMQILKLNGRLSYNNLKEKQTEQVLYNTIVTPRGGQYQVVLPDGSKVWLNAASSLRFPVAFTGTEREVEITGEAYFEVAKNKDMPFVVKNGEMEVQVLGTDFNVNAYEDEPGIKVTLVEGSVRVAQADTHYSQLIEPGQAAVLSKSGSGNIKVETADVEEATAWKNGLFVFNNTNIQSVMRQITRWYDTEVTYTGNINAHLNGMISRNTDLSRVLHMLELTGEAHFKVEGKTVTVLP